jgi:hypothetical protein
MEAQARIKKAGDQKWQNIKIKLPDSVAPYLEKYDMELIEYSGDPFIGIYFQDKSDPDTDVVSHTVRNQNAGNNMSDGFKAAFMQLRDIERQNET